MSDPSPGSIALLGPQRTVITAGKILATMAPRGRIATINAGWQEREGEDAEIDAVFGHRTVNLALYRRAERVWRDDPEFGKAYHEHHQQLRLLRRSYHVRLRRLMEAWSTLERMPGDPAVLDPERANALEALRTLDQHHLDRVRELRREFERRHEPSERPAIRREWSEIDADLQACVAVAVAGGHVAVLLNRLRLFGLQPLLRRKPIVAWSAGAMALSDRVILFHDSPPQGAGDAETMDVGLGLATDIVPLPHARHRLQLDDPVRVSRMARRFGPAWCVPLDAREGLRRDGDTWVPLVQGEVRGARRLRTDGRVEALVA